MTTTTASAALRKLGRSRSLRPVELFAWLGLAAFLAISGVSVVSVPTFAALLVGLVVAGFVAADWRRGVGVLVAFLPFAGLPVFFLGSKYAPVAKDIFIVLPLYASFVAAMVYRREPIVPRRDPVVPLLGLFSALALVYSLLSPSARVAAIGLKVWLFYLPLYVVGYHYIRSLDDLVRLLRRIVWLALVPTAVAFAEFYYFVRTGGFGPLDRLYGRFSDQIVHQVGFVARIPRIPSTFTFAGSYYNFALVALAAALAVWRFRRDRLSGALVVVLALATMASGERRSYFTVPILVVVAVGLMRAGAQTKMRVLLAGLAALATLIALGVPILGVSGQLEAGALHNVSAASAQFTPAFHHGAIGHGTGSGTNAAFRYGGLAPVGEWAEAWYTKALVEMGYLGLALAIALMVVLLWHGYRCLQELPQREREVAAPLWALLFVTALMLAKASELDWDPIDAYFWLVAGLLSGLAASTRRRGAQHGSA
ncbi:MAG: hypothetical protein ACYDA3_07375 [Gaiellaceae bacterium]